MRGVIEIAYCFIRLVFFCRRGKFAPMLEPISGEVEVLYIIARSRLPRQLRNVRIDTHEPICDKVEVPVRRFQE